MQPLTEFPKSNQATTLLIPGPLGALEVITTWPKNQDAQAVGIICHPDPRQEGTMHNKVVTTVARAMNHVGLATIRFNFRGVGNSAGEFGETSGEIDDLQAVIDWAKHLLPQLPLCLAGFSFGSFISASIANRQSLLHLISIAPPVHHYPFHELTRIHCPWLIIHGDQDEVVPFQEVQSFTECPPSPLKFIVMPGVGHFFHGHLIELRQYLELELANFLLNKEILDYT